MKVTFMAREYPPHVYGGAGVHLKFLSRELSRLMDVEVRYFGEGERREGEILARGYEPWDRMSEGDEPLFDSALKTLSVDLAMIRDRIDSDLVHTHTWYGALAGYLAKLLYQVPFVATVHSLEPLRPWKREQLGNAYLLSSWVEKVALENADRVVAVSSAVKEDVLAHFDVAPEKVAVIPNGIDPDLYRPVDDDSARRELGVEGDYILFVGRTSRQKGMNYLLEATDYLEGDVKVVLCTSAPDTKEVEVEYSRLVDSKPRALWINRLLPVEQYVELYSNAVAFACPSIYEPFGIINLEAMGCETPVVASAVGGITEVVVPGVTGFLVEPADPRALAEKLNVLLRDRDMAVSFGKAGRKRVLDRYSWTAIAKKTLGMYEELLAEKD